MIIFVNLTESELQNLYVVIHILNFILWGKRSFIGTLTHVPKNIITFLIVPHENENPMGDIITVCFGHETNDPHIRVRRRGWNIIFMMKCMFKRMQ